LLIDEFRIGKRLLFQRPHAYPKARDSGKMTLRLPLKNGLHLPKDLQKGFEINLKRYEEISRTAEYMRLHKGDWIYFWVDEDGDHTVVVDGYINVAQMGSDVTGGTSYPVRTRVGETEVQVYRPLSFVHLPVYAGALKDNEGGKKW